MKLTRDKIQRMIGSAGYGSSAGSSGGGGGDIIGYATQTWVKSLRWWGATFDPQATDPDNVTGALTGVTNITASGNISAGGNLTVTGNITSSGTITGATLAATTAMTINGKAVATQEWTGQNYVSIAFFSRLFQAYNGSTAVNPNDLTTTIDNIKAMFGFWTDQYLTALGKNPNVQPSSLYLSQLADVSIPSPTDGQVLTYSANLAKWIASNASSGTDMTTVWSNLAAADSSHQIDYSHLSGAISISNGTITIGSQSIPVLGNFLPLAGGTMSGIISRDAGGEWISGRDNAIIKTVRTSNQGFDWHPAVAIKTSLGCWTLGSVGGESLMLSYDTDENYNLGNNTSAVINFPAAGNTGTLALTTDLANFLPLTGGVMGGKITFNQGSSARDVGIIGTYDPNRAAAIWAIGSSYQIAADGLTMGNLYGACYAYYGTGYTYGAGKSGGHSFVWCQNGNPTVALGDNVWTSGGFIKNGSSDSYVLLGGGGHAAISALSVNYANSANFANYVYCSSHIGSWRLSSDWDGSYFWLTAKYDSSSLPCATAYATSAGTASSATYATSAGSADYATAAGKLTGIDSYYSMWGLKFFENGIPKDVSGCADMGNGLKVGYICIECSSDKVHSGYGNEINDFHSALALQYSNNNGVQIGSSTYASNQLTVYGGIYVYGYIYGTGAVSSLSDIRYKNVLRHFALDVETIANASIIQFTWREGTDTKTHVGGIAQEWQGFLPEAVSEDKEGRLSMDYGVIAYTEATSLARKVVEQQREIDDLKERLAKLERLLERRDAETQRD